MSDSHDQHVTPETHASDDQGVTPARAAHHAEHPATTALPFSETDWNDFQKSDIGAGGAVVVLMTAIFSSGLVLYTIIALVAWS